MKTRTLLVFLIILGGFIGCLNPAAEPPDPEDPAHPAGKKEGSYPQEEIVVKVSAATSSIVVDSLVGGKRIRTVASFAGHVYLLYRTAGIEPAAAILARLNGSPKVSAAEKDHPYKAYLVPTDPYYAARQYAPQIANAEAAWNTTTGNAAIIVAVLDTGINGEHEDFGPGRVSAGYNFISNAAIAAGANSDDQGHGTHVAGIIGATGNNGTGIAGLAWQISLMPVKVLDSGGSGTTSSIVAGAAWAVNNGADILNLSLGSIYYSQIAADVVNYALSNGVAVVVAMGNDGLRVRNFPAGHSGVIAVGSTNGRDELSSYSTTGTHISLSAPGENILSLMHSSNAGYIAFNGTSMSCPFVAGTVALMQARRDGLAQPTLTPGEVRSILEDTAHDLGTSGFDPRFGYGRVDVAAAVSGAGSPSVTNHYGSITVTVNNFGSLLADAEVLILDSTGSTTLASGRTSDGSGDGGTAGQVRFPLIREGSHDVVVHLYGETQTADNMTVTAGADASQTFNFSVTPPKTYIIETFANGSSPDADTVLELYDDTLSLLYSDDDGGAASFSRIEVDLLSGTYYAKVTGWFGTAGYYSLLINETGGGSSSATPPVDAGEPDDSAAAATAADLDVVYDRYLTTGDQDWFRVTIP